MHGLKSNLLTRASLGALVAAAAFSAAPAFAQTQTLQTGGATLPELVVRDLFACYTRFGNKPSVCANSSRVNSTTAFTYDSVGSGAGQRGWVSQERSRFLSPTQNTSLGPVAFAASEAALTSGNTAVYNNGGRFSSTGPLDIADQADNCVAQSTINPAPGNGQNFIPLTVPSTAGCFDNPRVEAGPAIQIPFIGVGVTVAFDPVYKRVRNADGSVTEYTFQFNDRGNGSGGLNLSRNAFCGIFSGQITRWNDTAITNSNGGNPVWPDPDDADAVAGTDTRGRQVVPTVRDDDSGTTALVTRAFRAQCPQFTSAVLPAGFAQTYPGNPTPNSLLAPVPPATFNPACDVNQGNTLFAGNWIYARGNEGVATCINTANPKKKAGSTAVGGRIGYLSPSFALPTVFINPFAGYALQTADLENSSNAYVAPDAGSVRAGLGTFVIPQDAARADPLNWVANPSGAVFPNPVANPGDADAYPIVGTSNLLLYTCYATNAVTNAIANPTGVPGFLNWLFDGQGNIAVDVQEVIEAQGFVQLPAALRTAIVETFAPNTNINVGPGNRSDLDLFIRPASSAPNSFCNPGAVASN